MAGRLQEAYATQETRIAERTRDLALANEAKTRFIAAASHDLRQPIHALALFVGQLRESKSQRDEDASLLEEIERSVEALRELLEALLDLSKLDVGAINPHPKPFALQGLLSRLAADFGRIAEEKGLALTVVPTSLWVRSDPLLLKRILLNLISNALRYTEQGRILVGCRRRADEVELIVADTGVGIDPDRSAARLPGVLPCHADEARDWRRDWVSDLRSSSAFPTCSAIEWRSPPLPARARSCGLPSLAPNRRRRSMFRSRRFPTRSPASGYWSSTMKRPHETRWKGC